MPAASRVIEGGIQAAKGVERPLHQPLDGGGVADVSTHGVFPVRASAKLCRPFWNDSPLAIYCKRWQ
jgi:hypothetical protein